MRTTVEDNAPRTARTIPPGDVHRAGFESVLPDDARSELVTPKRPRILGRPVKASHGLHRLGVASAVLVVLAAIVVIAFWQRPSVTPAPVAPAVLPAASPQPTPVLVQPLQPTAALEHAVEQPILPPRAQLLKLPTPRATLVALPQWHVGETRRLLMPYGLEVIGRLRGHSEDELYLSTTGNAIGDTWLVEGVPWIWLVAPGAATPIWIDP